jgi:hypothetical protein
MQKMVQEKEVPDNTVFWSIVGVVSVFVVVLAAIVVVRSDMTGNIVMQWFQPSRPFAENPYACLDVPMCGGSQSYMCCAENPLPTTGMKCTAPIYGYGSEAPMCPDTMPYKCPCVEKYPYKQSWPVPFS